MKEEGIPRRSDIKKASAIVPLSAALIVAILGNPPALLSQDASIIAGMESSTVFIVCPLDEHRMQTGSGFVVGNGTYVVTNWHVENGVKCAIALSPSELLEARLVTDSEQKDLALLQVERNLGKPAVGFAPRSFVNKAQKVYAAGFPGAANPEGIDLKTSLFQVKLTSGIVSAFVKNDHGTGLYQTDASIHHGNSGGPLFNECGSVIGVNEAGTEPGIGWAIQADELLPMLTSAGVSYNAASAPCVPASSAPVTPRRDPVMLAAVVGAALLGAGALITASTKRGRETVKQGIRTMTRYRSVPSPPPPLWRPVLRGVSGHYAGSEIELDDRPLYIGRDPRLCQLVFPSSLSDVSKRHCVLRFDSRTQTLLLDDCGSTNGTFLQSGEALKPGQPRPLRPYDSFYLGDRRIMFEVRSGRS